MTIPGPPPESLAQRVWGRARAGAFLTGSPGAGDAGLGTTPGGAPCGWHCPQGPDLLPLLTRLPSLLRTRCFLIPLEGEVG